MRWCLRTSPHLGHVSVSASIRTSIGASVRPPLVCQCVRYYIRWCVRTSPLWVMCPLVRPLKHPLVRPYVPPFGSFCLCIVQKHIWLILCPYWQYSLYLHLLNSRKYLHSFGCLLLQSKISHLEFSHLRSSCFLRHVTPYLQKPNLLKTQIVIASIFKSLFLNYVFF